MAKTQIADIFVPRDWEDYFIERTAELARFGQSGLVQRTPQFDGLAAGPGRIVDMPFWQDLSGARQLISDSASGNTNKIVSETDAARKHNDFNAWSTTLLSELLAGDDPMEAIIQLVGEYWAREDEDMLVATVNGILASFDAEGGDPNILKIASESLGGQAATTALTGETFIDAKQKLGDRKELLTAIAIHSEVQSDLMKQQLIEFIPDADGRQLMPFFQGLAVIMDDDLPKRAGTTSGSVYTSVLFGTGAVASGFASLDEPLEGGFGTHAVERSRVSLAHDEILINRRRHILHPRGVKWLEASGGIADAGPTNAQLALAANWERVYESKNVRIVGIVHNLLADSGS